MTAGGRAAQYDQRCEQFWQLHPVGPLQAVQALQAEHPEQRVQFEQPVQTLQLVQPHWCPRTVPPRGSASGAESKERMRNSSRLKEILLVGCMRIAPAMGRQGGHQVPTDTGTVGIETPVVSSRAGPREYKSVQRRRGTREPRGARPPVRAPGAVVRNDGQLVCHMVHCWQLQPLSCPHERPVQMLHPVQLLHPEQLLHPVQLLQPVHAHWWPCTVPPCCSASGAVSNERSRSSSMLKETLFVGCMESLPGCWGLMPAGGVLRPGRARRAPGRRLAP
jgi:hypothetical protein